MAHDVFISYAHEDQHIAESVAMALETKGIKCWYAPRNIPVGVDYEEAIVDGICDSQLVIFILSSHSNASPHVRREIQNAYADDVRRPILPVRIDDTPLHKALRYYLGSSQWLDASTPPIESHLQRLIEQVRPRLRPTTNGSAAPPAQEADHLKETGEHQKTLDVERRQPLAQKEEEDALEDVLANQGLIQRIKRLDPFRQTVVIVGATAFVIAVSFIISYLIEFKDGPLFLGLDDTYKYRLPIISLMFLALESVAVYKASFWSPFSNRRWGRLLLFGVIGIGIVFLTVLWNVDLTRRSSLLRHP